MSFDAEASLKQAMVAMLQSAQPAAPGHQTGGAEHSFCRTSFQDTVSRAHRLLDEAACELATIENACNPVNCLPPEILGVIFDLSGDESNGTLLRVCKHWHAAAMANGALWSRISLRLSIFPSLPSAIASLSARLGRTKNAPVDLYVDGTRRSTASPDSPDVVGIMEPLQNHMPHIRSLHLEGFPGLLFRPLWRVAFTMPAPQLRTLKLSIVRDDAAIFPDDLFSGEAPRLEELSLSGIRLPAPDWPPLRTVKHFTFRSREVVDIQHLAEILQASPHITSVTVQSARLALPHPTLVISGNARPPERVHLHSMALFPESLDFILRNPWRALPAHISMVDADLNLVRPWLQTSLIPHSLSIRVSDRDTAMISRDSVTICLEDPLHHTRIVQANSYTRLRDFRDFFPTLSELTLSDVLWPDDVASFPALPVMETLTIDLVDPVRAARRAPRHLGAGLFLLDIGPSRAWRLPQLRTLRLAYRVPGPGVADPIPGRYSAALNMLPAPYVVSAHEVALFLRWHLHSDRPLRLALLKVSLLEDMSGPDRNLLVGMVESISVESIRPLDRE
ncbi:hypothetical protein AURDEDRAFT_156603 [Auricularia subglabra TFB-10046 SS5]|nr:hypothetical protein AURDEDRAFT_156603 [Auricularia subglabra TFB-10046 SS5]